jgi:hypothetical protein
LAEKQALSPPSSNFCFSDIEKLDNFHVKSRNCGRYNQTFVSSSNSELIEFPIYCNNRSCNNEGCKEHRGYLFNRNHMGQISHVDDNIRKPKGWVFTGWVFPVPSNSFEVDNIRRFLQEKLIYLYRLLTVFSLTAFSVHMEIKPYPQGHKNEGKMYVHFHVVSGYINKLRVVRQRWKRQILAEDAKAIENLNRYVSKYASKTPYFDSEYTQEMYHLLVYKLHMHRFSIGKKDCVLSVRSCGHFIPYSLLEWEVFTALKNDRFYHPFVDLYNERRRGKPPPVCLDDFFEEGVALYG